jgi:hypothetical protein
VRIEGRLQSDPSAGCAFDDEDSASLDDRRYATCLDEVHASLGQNTWLSTGMNFLAMFREDGSINSRQCFRPYNSVKELSPKARSVSPFSTTSFVRTARGRKRRLEARLEPQDFVGMTSYFASSTSGSALSIPRHPGRLLRADSRLLGQQATVFTEVAWSTHCPGCPPAGFPESTTHTPGEGRPGERRVGLTARRPWLLSRGDRAPKRHRTAILGRFSQAGLATHSRVEGLEALPFASVIATTRSSGAASFPVRTGTWRNAEGS